jgi:hypothetical protein
MANVFDNVAFKEGIPGLMKLAGSNSLFATEVLRQSQIYTAAIDFLPREFKAIAKNGLDGDELRSEYRSALSHHLNGKDTAESIIFLSINEVINGILKSNDNLEKRRVDIGLDELILFVTKKTGNDAAKTFMKIVKEAREGVELEGSEKLLNSDANKQQRATKALKKFVRRE